MNRSIELPAALYHRLEKHASGFHQTPITVIENVLNAQEEAMAIHAAEEIESVRPTKYIFNNEKLDKNRLVLKVITDYVNSQEEDINLYQLGQAFPNELQGSLGVANKFYDVVKQYDGQPNKKHFIGEHELLNLQDGQVAIYSEWGLTNIKAFIKQAHALGYYIETESGSGSSSKRQSPLGHHAEYIFNNEKLDSSSLVLRVISDYVNKQEEDINLYQLSQAFPNSLQGSIGIANKFYDVVKQYDGQEDKCHFIGELELLDLQDGKVAVSTQWDASNIEGFISHARELGYQIHKADGSDAGAANHAVSGGDGKYSFDGKKLSASQLVLNVITDYVNKQEEDINLYQLAQAFPNELQGSIGIAKKYDDVMKEYEGQDNKCHFVAADELLDLQDGKVAISTEWHAENVSAFIKQARELDYSIEVDGVVSPIASEYSQSKRRTKYILNDEKLGASHLALNVITDYVNKQEEDINLYELGQAFPNNLQGSIGIANKLDDVMVKYDGQVNKRHFVKDQYLLDLQDGKVAICTEWDADNIEAFINQARELGYDIKIDGASESLAA